MHLLRFTLLTAALLLLLCGWQSTTAQQTATQAGLFPPASAEAPRPTVEVLRRAQTIFINSKSAYLKSSDLENELRKRLSAIGLALQISADNVNPDLVMEIGRRAFSTTFIYRVVDPHTGLLITSGKVNSLGGTVPTKIAQKFIRELQAARAVTTTK